MDRNMWVLCRCRGEIESINCFMVSLFLSSAKGGRERVSTEDCVDIWGQQFMVVHEDRTGRGGGICYAPCLVHTRVTVISDHSRLTWSPRSAGKLPPEPGQWVTDSQRRHSDQWPWSETRGLCWCPTQHSPTPEKPGVDKYRTENHKWIITAGRNCHSDRSLSGCCHRAKDGEGN